MTTPFGKRLEELRKRAGFSQIQLATQVGEKNEVRSDHSYISRLESGTRQPTRKRVEMLASVLDDTGDSLLIAAGYLPRDINKVVAEGELQLVVSELTDLAGQITNDPACISRRAHLLIVQLEKLAGGSNGKATSPRSGTEANIIRPTATRHVPDRRTGSRGARGVDPAPGHAADPRGAKHGITAGTGRGAA